MNSSNVSMTFSLTMRVMRLTLYPTTLVLGLVGNILVCILVICTRKYKKHSTAPRYFVLNLSISDFLVLIMFIPFDMVYLENDMNWTFGEFMCKLVNTITYVSVVVSGTTIACISVERYRSIVYPMRSTYQPKVIFFSICVIWIYAALTMSPFFDALRVFPNGNCATDYRWWPNIYYFKLTFVVSGFVPGFVIPAICIIISYSFIGVHLWREHKLNVKRGVIMRNVAAIRVRQNIRTTKILTGLVIVHSVCILPHYLVLLKLMFAVDENEHVTSHMVVIHEVTRLLVTANSCCNPLLYGLLSQDFRSGLKRMFCGRKMTLPSRNTSTTRSHNRSTIRRSIRGTEL